MSLQSVVQSVVVMEMVTDGGRRKEGCFAKGESCQSVSHAHTQAKRVFSSRVSNTLGLARAGTVSKEGVSVGVWGN